MLCVLRCASARGFRDRLRRCVWPWRPRFCLLVCDVFVCRFSEAFCAGFPSIVFKTRWTASERGTSSTFNSTTNEHVRLYGGWTIPIRSRHRLCAPYLLKLFIRFTLYIWMEAIFEMYVRLRSVWQGLSGGFALCRTCLALVGGYRAFNRRIKMHKMNVKQFTLIWIILLHLKTYKLNLNGEDFRSFLFIFRVISFGSPFGLL